MPIIDPTVALITLSFMFLIVLLLIGTIHSKLHWIVKSTLIVSSIIVVGIVYRSYTTDLGWPIADKLPEKFEFVSGIAYEPTPDDTGCIYVWYVTQESRIPRSIKIPYSKDNHKKVIEANEKKKDGKKVYMKTQGPNKPKDGLNIHYEGVMEPDPNFDPVPSKDPTDQ